MRRPTLLDPDSAGRYHQSTKLPENEEQRASSGDNSRAHHETAQPWPSGLATKNPLASAVIAGGQREPARL
jgi:hypothetical protein